MSETLVNTYTTGSQYDPQITALADGGWVVTWMSDGQDGSGTGVYQQAYNAAGTKVGGETRVNTYTLGHQDNPQITGLDGGGWVVTWGRTNQHGDSLGVYQQVYAADGTAVGPETRVNSPAYGGAGQKITWLVDGGWVVTWWSGGADGSSHGVYQQAYAANGTTVGPETLVNTTTYGQQDDPEITALAGGGWVVVWKSIGQDLHWDVYQQAYAANGTASGPETLVNTYTDGDQWFQQITALANGGWVVTWQSGAWPQAGQDGSGLGVYQQAYAADGTAIGPETRVNTWRLGDQKYPQVAGLADGGWVVTWMSDNQDGSGAGIYQQAYAADGTAVGSETLVNTYTDGEQFNPRITALAGGGWVVTWTSDGQDGSGSGVYQGAGVYQQVYAANGTALGPETRVNTYTNDDQLNPRVVALADGGWVVTWESKGQDGSDYGVYQRAFGLKQGGSGNDTLTGGAASDYLFGFGGDDTLDGGADADLMYGGQGHDTYHVDNVDDVVVERAGEGIDRVFSSVSYTLTANVENLTLIGSGNIHGTGNALDNILIGNTGHNILDGKAGADTMQGGLGDDTYVVDDAGDTVVEAANAGTDQVVASISYALTANVENLTLTGSGNIYGGGNALNNVITGNAGHNYLMGGLGADRLDGGAGIDTASYWDSDTGVTVTLGSGSVAGRGFGGTAEGDTLIDIESLIGSDYDDVLTGNAQDNVLDGGEGADTLRGGLGDDAYVVDHAGDKVIELANQGWDWVVASISYTLTANVEDLTLTGSGSIDGTGNALDNILIGNHGNNKLNGKAGADTMQGGLGNDTYYVDNAGDRAIEAVNGGTDRVISTVSLTLGANVENLTLAGSDAINGTGNDLDNAITGNAGANVLNGKAGADIMRGGNGNDTYYVDNAGDRAIEAVNGGTDRVISTVNLTLGANVENLTLAGSDAINGTGNDLDNAITGNAGANVLNGKAGADIMRGGNGNDTYYVDNAGDRAIEAVNGGTDRVISTVNLTLGANVENLTLAGSDAINGTGNDLDNIIVGNTGNNVLRGGLGNDRLTGGLGHDTFHFDKPASATNLDRITDFNVDDDRIWLEDTVFTALHLGALDPAAFANITSAGSVVGTDQHILYNQANGALYYDADGGSAAGRVQIARIDNKAALTHADLFVV